MILTQGGRVVAVGCGLDVSSDSVERTRPVTFLRTRRIFRDLACAEGGVGAIEPLTSEVLPYRTTHVPAGNSSFEAPSPAASRRIWAPRSQIWAGTRVTLAPRSHRRPQCETGHVFSGYTG